MKKSVLILIALFPFISKILAKGDISKSRWISDGIIIDGNDNDWIKPLNCYDDKTGLMFAVGNDWNGLYMCFTCTDHMKMRKMMNAGWKLAIISREKKKKFKAEIDFPAVNMAGAGMGIRMRRSDSNKNNLLPVDNPIKFYSLNLGSIPVSGFISNKQEIKLHDNSGINIAVGSDSNQHIIYEIAIPFRELYGDQKVNPDDEITLNVVVNGIERPNSSGTNFGGGRSGMGGGRMGGGMSGMSSRGGGRMGGGLGGGRYGSGMNQGGSSRGFDYSGMAGMFESASFKQKFSLTGNQ